ncbi:MAG: putative metal-binding motif-containing protein [archaeon]
MEKRLKYILLFLIMLTISAYSTAAVCYDDDGDNYGLGEIGDCKGEDCNDNDPFVNVGADELCDNGIDDNCNGEIDETGCSYCVDHDRDGYGDPGSNDCTGGLETDCDDTDKEMSPGISELNLCEDGKDNDCDGLIDADDSDCIESETNGGTTGSGGTGGSRGGQNIVIVEDIPKESTNEQAEAESKESAKPGEILVKESEESPELEVMEPGFPWVMLLIALVAVLIGGAVLFLLLKKPATGAPASLIEYVEKARAKKMPDKEIKKGLLKSGWKPEQIAEAFKTK